jgi:hypothetical protein
MNAIQQARRDGRHTAASGVTNASIRSLEKEFRTTRAGATSNGVHHDTQRGQA